MHDHKRAHPSLLFGTLALCLLGPGRALAEQPTAPLTSAPELAAPARDTLSVEEVEKLELVTQRVAEEVVPSVVGLFVDGVGGMASGVIVSPDGWIMTVGHAIKSPFQPCTVVLHDGTEVAGVTLGKNGRYDMGLCRILEEREEPWPYAPLGDSDLLRTNQPSLMVGHPGGMAPGRPPVVRFGSISDPDGRFFRSTARIQPGDSGGGLFDLEGHLIGIASRIEVELAANDFVPVERFRSAWARLARGETWQPDPNLPFLRDDQDPVPGYEDAGEPDAEPPPIARRSLLSRDTLSTNARSELRRALDGTYAAEHPSVALIRGRRGLRRIETLATVVDPSGLLLAKASALGGYLRAELSDGRELAARVLATDEETDLALLSVSARNLEAVDFASASTLNPGQFVIAPGAGFGHEVGVVGVAARDIPARGPGYLGIRLGRRGGQGALVDSVEPNTGAERAGFRAGDRVVAVNGREVSDGNELISTLHLHAPGQSVEVSLLRDGEGLELSATLGSRPDLDERPLFHAADQISVSDRRDRFPDTVRTDLVLDPERCGGPLVDLEGQVVGLNIARVDRVGSLALSSEAVQASLTSLRQAAGLRRSL